MSRAQARVYEPVANVDARYRPPTDVTTTTLRALLSGSPRGILDQKQLSFVSSLAGPQGGDDLKVFAAGDEALLRKPCVSIVGTRKVSEEGAARARRLSREIAREGVVVVSGLAEGVDTEAMSATMKYGGNVVGVIGTPLDQAYPAKNKRLQEEVYMRHLLLSQFPTGTRVFKANFPQRNRLMATISDATVVIEASDTSGTLHQAAECMRLGRWLFIARSVVEDPTLTWPKRFVGLDKCVVLEKAADVLDRVHPQWRS